MEIARKGAPGQSSSHVRGYTERRHRAERRMNAGDGGLAKHSVECPNDINWEAAKITGRESGTMQRKMLEGVESLKDKYRGRTPLNSYNHFNLEPWQSTIYSFLEKT